MGAVLQEVPQPPPETPEREPERSPDYERSTISVGAAGAWVADVHRAARDLAGRSGGNVAVSVELDDGRKLVARDLRSGPGIDFVTFALEDVEVAVRLDRVTALELAASPVPSFRLRGTGFGFDR